ncbi:MAG: hypothetical protein IJU71_10565, partial [Selenomonadaceae bacterium]|nr:hypothetical protein [Selenomonadaceae bacterium]
MSDINNVTNNKVITGTFDDDVIINLASNVTIEGSLGDDTLYLNGSNQLLDYASRYSLGISMKNDEVHGFGVNDTIRFDTNSWSSYFTGNLRAIYALATVEGDDVMLSSYVNNGRGYVTLLGAANNKINFLNGETLKHLYITSDTADQEINGASDIDYLINFSSGATVNAAGSIVYNHRTALVNGTNGADTIYNLSDDSTVNGGAGNDSLANNANNVSIGAGAGNDTITNHGSSVTINGGTGNDYIYGNVVQYAEGDGNDTVVGFSENSMLNISAGAIGSASTDGIAAVIRVGDGSIRLNRMAGRNFKLMDADGNASTTMIGDVAYTPDEGGSFENSTNGKIIKIAGGDTSVTLNGSKQIIDCEAYESNITIYGYDADDTVRISDWHFAPPEIDGNDVRLVSNWEGGGSITFKNVINKKITLISNDGTDLYVMPGGATINNDIDYVENYTDGVSISLGSGVSEFINLDNCADNVTVNAVGKAYIRHGGGSNVSIKTGAGNDNIDSDDGEERVLLKNNVTIDAGDGDNSIRFNGETGEGLHSRNLNIKAGNGNNQISVSRVDKVLIDAGDGNNFIGDIFYNSEIEDVTIKSGSGSDNLYGSFVNANIDLGDGWNDVGDYFERLNGYNITLKTGAYDDNFYVNGRYISIDAGDGNNNFNLNGLSNGVVSAGSGNDLLRASSIENVMVNAGAGNDTIAGDFKGATLNAGKDNDLVSITGDGGWLYQYANGDGNDTIDVSGSPNGAPGVIHVASGSVSSVTRNGNNAVVNVGSGSIVLNGYANFDVPIAIKDSSGDVSVWYKNGSSLTKFDGDSTVRNGVFINTANNVLLDELSVENVINYGDNVTIDVDEGTAVTLNGSSQVITYERYNLESFGTVYGFGTDDSLYFDEWWFGPVSYSDEIQISDAGDVKISALTLKDAANKKINFTFEF